MVNFMLIEYRKRLKISRKNLADMIGVDERTIFIIEHDTSIPLLDTYAKIVYALKMTDNEVYLELMKIIEKEKIHY